MHNYQLKEFDFINSIIKHVNEYNDFITELNTNYLLLKQEIENYEYGDLSQKYKNCFDKLYKYYLKFANVLRNNLFDYNLSDNEAKEICENDNLELLEFRNRFDCDVKCRKCNSIFNVKVLGYLTDETTKNLC